MGRRGLLKVTAGLMAALLAAAWTAPRAEAAVDERELRAREAFAVGHYQEALDLFAKLYAEKVHPNYLRNIGRCYQNLGDPDKAITSFKDYLRKAKNVTPEERQEVEGYIKEMQDLKVQREAAKPPDRGPGAVEPAGGGAGSATSGTPAGGGPTALPRATDTSQASAIEPAGTQLTNGGAPAPSGESGPPVYQRWWFWLIVGGVAAAGLGTAAALGAFTKTEDAKCPEGTKC